MEIGFQTPGNVPGSSMKPTRNDVCHAGALEPHPFDRAGRSLSVLLAAISSASESRVQLQRTQAVTAVTPRRFRGGMVCVRRELEMGPALKMHAPETGYARIFSMIRGSLKSGRGWGGGDERAGREHCRLFLADFSGQIAPVVLRWTG
jgi:hypothetical protein